MDRRSLQGVESLWRPGLIALHGGDDQGFFLHMDLDGDNLIDMEEYKSFLEEPCAAYRSAHMHTPYARHLFSCVRSRAHCVTLLHESSGTGGTEEPAPRTPFFAAPLLLGTVAAACDR